ncbi:eukaryotic translation elongation factor 1 epsilon-1 [Maniola hyperantus]|uniref:eukaryotic translation elongation factor 1 epsilon-1 n=1 Tax=Aphantopus hyperantus TaxID=2795564 RepID=UPI001569D1EB|nr:eukaryotic translation elongation factor 1 epsilon-1 isoform X1 [Maniola hyperantus]
MDVVKLVGKYLNIPVGTVCYNTDKVLTTVLDKENIEGFATIILRLATKSGVSMTNVQTLLSYQWLEHLSMYANQAHANPTFAKTFLQGLNKGLQKNTFLTGNHLTITDIAAYYTIYPMMERLTILEQESLVHVCRWMKHLQSKPKLCGNKPPLSLNTLNLSILAPAVH